MLRRMVDDSESSESAALERQKLDACSVFCESTPADAEPAAIFRRKTTPRLQQLRQLLEPPQTWKHVAGDEHSLPLSTDVRAVSDRRAARKVTDKPRNCQ